MHHEKDDRLFDLIRLREVLMVASGKHLVFRVSVVTAGLTVVEVLELESIF